MANRRARALELLQSKYFFPAFLQAVSKAGLVGEERNALVVFIVGISRLLAKPLSLFVKGASSAGKNFLVKTVLRFFPPKEVVEISSSSRTSWNYLGKDLKHRIVYIQEENAASGNVHPARLLISENRLVRLVSRPRSGGGFVTEREETEGPVACISTTTKNRMEIDDETRHLSAWPDDSPEQTRDILMAQTEDSEGIDAEELAVWHEVQRLLATRANWPVEIPEWFTEVTKLVEVGEVRARRYFAAFLQVCKVVCLIRSFRQKDEELQPRGKLRVGFIDFATATLMFASTFELSLGRSGLEEFETRKIVDRISRRKGGADVEASDLVAELGMTKNEAYGRIRRALKAGHIVRVNRPEKGNRKLYRPAPIKKFLPDPEKVFRELPFERNRVRFIHPVTGEVVEYRKGRKAQGGV